MVGKRKPLRRGVKSGKAQRMQKPSETLGPWQDPSYNAKLEYDAMRSLFASCWCCGATRKPLDYFGPWMIERAHIVNKPRREDRRLVVMLCTICHKSSHGERLAGFERPKLSPGNMAWIKQQVDPEWFDLPFINAHSVRIIEVEQVWPTTKQDS